MINNIYNNSCDNMFNNICNNLCDNMFNNFFSNSLGFFFFFENLKYYKSNIRRN